MIYETHVSAKDGSFNLFLKADPDDGSGVTVAVSPEGHGHHMSITAVGPVGLKRVGDSHDNVLQYYIRQVPRVTWPQVIAFGTVLGGTIGTLLHYL